MWSSLWSVSGTPSSEGDPSKHLAQSHFIRLYYHIIIIWTIYCNHLGFLCDLRTRQCQVFKLNCLHAKHVFSLLKYLLSSYNHLYVLNRNILSLSQTLRHFERQSFYLGDIGDTPSLVINIVKFNKYFSCHSSEYLAIQWTIHDHIQISN